MSVGYGFVVCYLIFWIFDLVVGRIGIGFWINCFCGRFMVNGSIGIYFVV